VVKGVDTRAATLLQQPVTQCQATLEQLRKEVLSDEPKSLRKRLAWGKGDEQRIFDFVEILERYKTTFNLALQIDLSFACFLKFYSSISLTARYIVVRWIIYNQESQNWSQADNPTFCKLRRIEMVCNPQYLYHEGLRFCARKTIARDPRLVEAFGYGGEP
jgi:hypothetical protein